MSRTVVLLLVYRHLAVMVTTTNAGMLHTIYSSVTMRIVVAACTCRLVEVLLVRLLALRCVLRKQYTDKKKEQVIGKKGNPVRHIQIILIRCSFCRSVICVLTAGQCLLSN